MGSLDVEWREAEVWRMRHHWGPHRDHVRRCNAGDRDAASNRQYHVIMVSEIATQAAREVCKYWDLKLNATPIESSASMIPSDSEERLSPSSPCFDRHARVSAKTRSTTTLSCVFEITNPGLCFLHFELGLDNPNPMVWPLFYPT